MTKRSSEDFEKYMMRKMKKLEEKFKKKLAKRSRRNDENYCNSEESCEIMSLHDENTLEMSVCEPPEQTVDPDMVINESIDPAIIEPPIPEENLPVEILEILGECPSLEKIYGKDLHSDIAVRWEYIATSGLTKDQRKLNLEKYQIPQNTTKIGAPVLNAEIKAALSDILTKKDKAIEYKQRQIAMIISYIGEALTSLLSSKDSNLPLIKLLTEAGKLACDLQHTESRIRRGFICSSIKKEIRDQLYETKIDNYLFGEQLAETLKAAKAINKSGSELKNQPVLSLKSNQALNSKPRPPPSGRHMGVTRRQTYNASTTMTRTNSRQAPYRPPPPPPPRQRGYLQRSRMQTQHRK